ncbi:MAG TPA: proline--tRNA ligase [Burkholderiaceae bacterium]|nr:proline--tRNA ligase [Burkholderiaceae bacterium]
MRASAYYISTLKEAPADAEVVSHRLMLRASMIRRAAAGIYTYLPLGLRSIRRIERIVREEMDRAGAIELLMPVIQPAELWIESGRWQKMGPELLRVKDRHERDFVVQPTSEEVIADLARESLRSYKQLPANFYHIQTKFRDERRPRFGVMRGREFTMKDAYSFDRDEEGARRSYQAMYDAYQRIFTRLGLSFRAVAADTGNIGGNASHEFQVIADTGEDAIAWCPTSDYAANVETAEALPLIERRLPPAAAFAKTPTPGKARCEDVAELLRLPLVQTVKSIVLAVDQPDKPAEVWLLLLRGDHELNEIKASKVPGLDVGFRFATPAEILDHFGCPPGYLGPIGTRRPVRVVADRTVAMMSDFVCGANETDYHFSGVNWGRDLPLPELVADLRNVVAGDPSPDGRGVIAIQRGIEVGHVFAGLPYPERMKLQFIDESGQPRIMRMGCYGIGITRLLGAAIEQNHDERGIIWPDAMAPFQVALCPVNYRQSAPVRELADRLHAELESRGIDVLLDDRGERPGAMFADMELIGIPHRLTIGERGIKSGELEYVARRTLQTTPVPLGGAVEFLAGRLRDATQPPAG